MRISSETEDEAFERMTKQMESKLDKHRPRQVLNVKDIVADIPSDFLPYSQSQRKEFKAQENDHKTLKKRFLAKYGPDKLEKFISRWLIEVNGSDFGRILYEYPALQDFFEAKKFGNDNLINRAIQIGLEKRR